MRLPKVHIGSVKKSSERQNWRKSKVEVDPDDDEMDTPSDVIKMLGFDPKRKSKARNRK
jgi:hypothetical protein